MRNRLGLFSKFQCNNSLRFKAAFAKYQVVLACAVSGSGVFTAFLKALIMRARISAEDFLVNVMAKISSGCFTWLNKLKKRCVSNSVFPEPAGACTMNDFWGFSAIWRCFWSGIVFIMFNFFTFLRLF